MKELIGRYLMVCESALRFPKDVNESLIGIWCLALDGLEEQDVKHAFESWLKSEPEFPTPAEIRGIATRHAWRRTQPERAEEEKPKAILARLPADQRVTKDDIEAYRKERLSMGSRLHAWLEKVRRAENA